MKRPRSKILAQANACATLLLLLASCSPKHEEKVWLWAWERDEDLTWLDTSSFGVAYLAASYSIDPSMISEQPRRQKLQVPDGIEKIPVFRLEASVIDSAWRPELVVNRILRYIDSNAQMVQIDFDAKLSQREWYAGLIKNLRDRLPATTRISITALASWAMSDPWIDSLPIDEAVPMLFDMGVDDRNMRTMLMHNKQMRSKKARGVYGLATDEEMPIDVRGSRVYLFSPRNWSKPDLDKVLAYYHLDE